MYRTVATTSTRAVRKRGQILDKPTIERIPIRVMYFSLTKQEKKYIDSPYRYDITYNPRQHVTVERFRKQNHHWYA